MLVGALGCVSSRPEPPRFTEADYPGLLRPPAELSGDVLWQQRVTASFPGRPARGFDAAIQKQGDTLTVIGLSPVGSTAFAIVLRGTAIEFRNETDEDLPFPPRFILLDVQRVFFPWLPEGQTEGRVGDEGVVETVVGGRLVERRFTRSAGKPEGAITVRYTWGDEGWRAPRHAELDNDWLGYRLTIDTLVETALPPAEPAR